MSIALVFAVLSLACPPVPPESLDGAEAEALAMKSWLAGPASVDPKWTQTFIDYATARAARNGGNAAPSEGGVAELDLGTYGRWQAPKPWPVIAINAALMPDGRVLHYSWPIATPGSAARLWNPTTGEFANVDVGTDVFCSGMSHLADGSLYITGGNNTGCPFQGRDTMFLFDTDSLWTFIGNMAVERWYPSNITLGDGSVITVSGLDAQCELTDLMEHYVPGEGIREVPLGSALLNLYPRLHLLSDGRVAHTGPESWAGTFDFEQGWRLLDTQTDVCGRYAGASVAMPGQPDHIMVFGGTCHTPTNTADLIDCDAASPTWTPTTPMHFARAHLNPVLLPDGRILAIGGGLQGYYDDPVLVPEMYDPKTAEWLMLPPHVYGRMYHSTALLLPSGRVIVAGQTYGDSAFWGEVYEPPYLFRGPRPEIVTSPTKVDWGQPFVITALVPGYEQRYDGGVQKVALMRLGSATHSVDFDQRHLWLEFYVDGKDQEGSTLVVAKVPANPNVVPPGYYMLFVINPDGVPSEAKMLQVAGEYRRPRPVFGDINGNGIVNGADLGLLLGQWGRAGEADLDGNGVVDGGDLGLLLGVWQ